MAPTPSEHAKADQRHWVRKSTRKIHKEGPSKHSAKQKTFVTVLAWSVFLLLRPGKAPSTSGGLFQASGERQEERRMERGYLFSPVSQAEKKELDSRGPHRRAERK